MCERLVFQNPRPDPCHTIALKRSLGCPSPFWSFPHHKVCPLVLLPQSYPLPAWCLYLPPPLIFLFCLPDNGCFVETNCLPRSPSLRPRPPIPLPPGRSPCAVLPKISPIPEMKASPASTPPPLFRVRSRPHFFPHRTSWVLYALVTPSLVPFPRAPRLLPFYPFW